MSKKTCFMIFIAVSVCLFAAYIFQISQITTYANAIFGAMHNPYIAGAALILAFLLSKQKYFWLIMFGCAVLTAIAITFISGGHINAAGLIYKSAAFIVYVYWLVLVRFML